MYMINRYRYDKTLRGTSVPDNMGKRRACAAKKREGSSVRNDKAKAIRESMRTHRGKSQSFADIVYDQFVLRGLDCITTLLRRISPT